MSDRLNELAKVLSNTNLRSVYHDIRAKGPVKKSEVGLSLSLSKPTRYSLIKELQDSGLLLENGDTEGKKRRSEVDILEDTFYSIGVDIHLSGVDFLLMNAKTTAVAHFQVPNRIDLNRNVTIDERDTIVERIKEGIQRILTEYQLSAENILSIGVSDYGTIDTNEGISVLAPHIPGWVDVPIRSIIQRIVPVPVYLGRDANLMAIGEIKALDLPDFDDLLCISMRRGIGLGIFIDGKLYTGHTGNAGEWSHVTITDNGKTCECGRSGCVDTVLSYSALRQSINKNYGKQTHKNAPGAEEGSEKISLTDVFEAYEQGDKTATGLLKPYIETLGDQIANLYYLFDPSVCILTGYYAFCGDRFLADLQQKIRSTIPEHIPKTVRLLRGSLGMKSASWGAAFMAQEMLLSPDQTNISKRQVQDSTISRFLSG